MARPIRIEFEGTFYHVTSRGDRIYIDGISHFAVSNVVGKIKKIGRKDARVKKILRKIANHSNFLTPGPQVVPKGD